MMGAPPCALMPHPPSCPWEPQSTKPVSKLTLLVNGAATSGRVSQPNKILIGKLLGNSLIWPEGIEMVFCLAVNTVTYFFGVHCNSLSLDFFFWASSQLNLWLTRVSWGRAVRDKFKHLCAQLYVWMYQLWTHYVLKQHFGKYFHLPAFNLYRSVMFVLRHCSNLFSTVWLYFTRWHVEFKKISQLSDFLLISQPIN